MTNIESTNEPSDAQMKKLAEDFLGGKPKYDYPPYTPAIGVLTKVNNAKSGIVNTFASAAPEAAFTAGLGMALNKTLEMRNRIHLLRNNLVGTPGDEAVAPNSPPSVHGPLIPVAIDCASFINNMMNDCEHYLKEINNMMPEKLKV